MGQYHTLYNITKKQKVSGHGLGCGIKLLEQIGDPHSTSIALFLLIANSNGRGGGDAEPHGLIGSWAGDQVVIQGDYAEDDDPSYLSPEQLEEFDDVSNAVKASYSHCDY